MLNYRRKQQDVNRTVGQMTKCKDKGRRGGKTLDTEADFNKVFLLDLFLKIERKGFYA